MPIRILIADDNASVRAAMRQVLLYAGDHWEIAEAENGSQAVALAHELKPNLIIIDLVMPLMDGLTAARKITRDMPHIPILMHTLYPFPQVKLEAEKVGMRVVPKSDGQGLVSAVERVLNSQKLDRFESPPVSSNMDTGMRRSEDKIRELSNQLFATGDNTEHSSILAELQDALHSHIQQLRERVADYPVLERRVRNQVRPPEKAAGTAYKNKH